MTMALRLPVPLRVSFHLARPEISTTLGVYLHKQLTRHYPLPVSKIEHPLYRTQSRLVLSASQRPRPLLKKISMGKTLLSKGRTLVEDQLWED